MNVTTHRIRIGLLAPAAVLALATASISMAQDDLRSADPEVTVDRSGTELQALLRPRPDVDLIDTAMVFNNPRPDKAQVWCVAFGYSGAPVGRIRLEIPARGVRFFLASDIANNLDFIGSAQCHSRNQVFPSAFVVGAAFSDAPALAHHHWDRTTVRFPVIVTR